MINHQTEVDKLSERKKLVLLFQAEEIGAIDFQKLEELLAEIRDGDLITMVINPPLLSPIGHELLKKELMIRMENSWPDGKLKEAATTIAGGKIREIASEALVRRMVRWSSDDLVKTVKDGDPLVAKIAEKAIGRLPYIKEVLQKLQKDFGVEV